MVHSFCPPLVTSTNPSAHTQHNNNLESENEMNACRRNANTLIQQECIKLMKNDNWEGYKRFLLQINVMLNFLFIRKIPGKRSRFPQKYLVFNIDNNTKYFPSSKLYLKDHVTLKTEVTIIKIQLCITEIHYIWTYFQIENSYFSL